MRYRAAKRAILVGDRFEALDLLDAQPSEFGQSARQSVSPRPEVDHAHAIEQLPADALAGAYLEVKEQRFDRNGIRQLYDSDAYPLPRAKTES